MASPRFVTPGLPVAAIGVVAMLALTACGGTSKAGSANSPAPSTGTSTPPTSAPPSTTPASPPASGQPSGDARFLTAEELPGLNDKTVWATGRTGPANAQPFSVCEQFTLATIGAKSVVARSFTSDGGTASEQLATFPDAMTAVRASRVISSWHDSCRKKQARLLPHLKVGPLNDVPVSVGKGSWYLASWEPKGTDGHFQGVGMVVDRATIALITMDDDGQDYNYSAGHEPIALAVQAAAGKLG